MPATGTAVRAPAGADRALTSGTGSVIGRHADDGALRTMSRTSVSGSAPAPSDCADEAAVGVAEELGHSATSRRRGRVGERPADGARTTSGATPSCGGGAVGDQVGDLGRRAFGSAARPRRSSACATARTPCAAPTSREGRATRRAGPPPTRKRRRPDAPRESGRCRPSGRSMVAWRRGPSRGVVACSVGHCCGAAALRRQGVHPGWFGKSSGADVRLRYEREPGFLLGAVTINTIVTFGAARGGAGGGHRPELPGHRRRADACSPGSGWRSWCPSSSTRSRPRVWAPSTWPCTRSTPRSRPTPRPHAEPVDRLSSSAMLDRTTRSKLRCCRHPRPAKPCHTPFVGCRPNPSGPCDRSPPPQAGRNEERTR